MQKRILFGVFIFTLCMAVILFSASSVIATTETVQEQEPAYKYTTKPTEKLFIQKTSSKDLLVSNMTAGVIQGVDTNPLLDSTKKADSYTQEMLDMHFKYPVYETTSGPLNSRFGFNINNVNYYNITDVNIMDNIADVNFDYDIRPGNTLSAGYVFELLWFPNDRDGTFVGNEINTSLKQKLTRNTYQKLTYRLLIKDYTERKVMLGSGTLNSDLRHDLRNTFEHELGVYIGRDTKVKVINQFYINDSNYQYYDYYDYFNYRVGGSVTQILTDKLYAIAGFYYQRRNYDSRQVSDGNAYERDNLYLMNASMMYDITKRLSAFISYSHTENHTNEPLEKYSDTLYSAGVYYSF